jgi:hypothetical protein
MNVLNLVVPLLLAAATQTATPAKDVPIPAKIPSPPSEETAPTVRIHTGDNGDVVEEYRQNGQLYMVRVTPPHGVPYTLLDSNGDGKLDKTDNEGTVSPVYWTLYQWD